MTVPATASLTAYTILQSTGVTVLTGGGGLSLDTELVASQTATRLASATLSAGTGCLSDGGIAVRVGTANISFDSALVAAGGGTFLASATIAGDLSASGSGGKIFSVTPVTLEGDLSVSLNTPGRLFDGGAVAMSAETDMDTTTSPVFRLVLPTRKAVFTSHPLFRRFPIDTGVAMLVTGGQVTLVDSPSDTELKAADIYYLGGYRHQITSAERSVIVAAGYGDLIEEA